MSPSVLLTAVPRALHVNGEDCGRQPQSIGITTTTTTTILSKSTNNDTTDAFDVPCFAAQLWWLSNQRYLCDPLLDQRRRCGGITLFSSRVGQPKDCTAGGCGISCELILQVGRSLECISQHMEAPSLSCNGGTHPSSTTAVRTLRVFVQNQVIFFVTHEIRVSIIAQREREGGDGIHAQNIIFSALRCTLSVLGPGSHPTEHGYNWSHCESMKRLVCKACLASDTVNVQSWYCVLLFFIFSTTYCTSFVRLFQLACYECCAVLVF